MDAAGATLKKRKKKERKKAYTTKHRHRHRNLVTIQVMKEAGGWQLGLPSKKIWQVCGEETQMANLLTLNNQ